MNRAKHIFPEFYNEFRCIASDCPDSCCKDWDVVVDDEASEFYSSLEGEFGSRLKSKMTIDNDGDRIFISDGGKCPFWNQNHLCDIYIKLGEEHLCGTCKEFPRITQDYTVFVEHMLSFACPEAARIMLRENCRFEMAENLTVGGDNIGYDADMMNFLLAARKKSCDLLRDRRFSFKNGLKRCLAFNEFVQYLIYKECFDIPKLSKYNFQYSIMPQKDRSFIFELHSNLDIMNKNWLLDLCASSESVLSDSKEIDYEFVNMALYYIFRYYLGAIDSFNAVNTVKRIVCAYVVISSMIAHNAAEHNFDRRVLLMQQYSKEVEHSYENSELLEERFMNDPNFSADELLRIL